MQNEWVPIAIISFALGIAWQSTLEQGTAFAVFLLLLLLITIIFVARHRRVLILVVIMFSMFTLGVLRMQVTQVGDTEQASVLKSRVGQQVDIEGVIVAEPDKREYSTNLVIKTSNMSTKVLAKASAYGEYMYGDTVRVSGRLERVENFSNETGREFNYKAYLAKDDIFYIIKRANVERQQEAQHKGVAYWLFYIKQSYLSNIASVIAEPESALAGGITVGSKNSLGKELLEQFRKTGVIHIVVLSGFNVAIIVIFLTYIFSFAGPTTGRLLAASGIVLFAILTGGGATVVRASAMGLLALMALTVRRKYAVMRALLLVGFVMLLFNPKILLASVSFQLSFVATLGMILGMPILLRYLAWLPETFKLREIVGATIATQIFVSPLLLYYMGEISVVAIVANILVLPLVTVSMLVVFLTGLFGFVSSILSLPFAYVSYILLHSIVVAVQALAALPHITLSVQGFGIYFVLLAYTLIGVGVWLLHSASDDTPVYIR